MEIALHYARIVSNLRRQRLLGGRSHNDPWIAATARSHGARLLTRNPADFKNIRELEVIGYAWDPTPGLAIADRWPMNGSIVRNLDDSPGPGRCTGWSQLQIAPPGLRELQKFGV